MATLGLVSWTPGYWLLIRTCTLVSYATMSDPWRIILPTRAGGTLLLSLASAAAAPAATILL